MILNKHVTLPNCSVYKFNLRLCLISHTARTCPVHVASFHQHPSLGMGRAPNSLLPTYTSGWRETLAYCLLTRTARITPYYRKCVFILPRQFAIFWINSVCLQVQKLALAEYAKNVYCFKKRNEKLAFVVHGIHNSWKLVISRC